MTDAERVRPSILDPGTLRRLFRHLEATDVDEVEVVWGSSRLYIRREPGVRTLVQRATDRPDDSGAPGAPILAPLTGVFYARPSPEQPSFVAPGDLVLPGQIVGLIETMKLFNEVTADRAGEVVSIAVADGDLVEAGQPLIYLAYPAEGELA